MKISDPALAHLATAKQLLLDPYLLDEAQLQKVLAMVFEHRTDYADLYFQYSRSESFSLEEGIVKSGSFDIEQGVGVRAIVGDKTAFAYSDDISLDSLTEAAVSARSIARHGQGKVKVASKVAVRSQPARYADADPVASLDASAKVRMLEKVEQMARARDPRVKQVMASVGADYDVILVARSDGVLAADVRPLVRLSVTVIVEQDGKREQGQLTSRTIREMCFERLTVAGCQCVVEQLGHFRIGGRFGSSCAAPARSPEIPGAGGASVSLTRRAHRMDGVVDVRLSARRSNLSDARRDHLRSRGRQCDIGALLPRTGRGDQRRRQRSG